MNAKDNKLGNSSLEEKIITLQLQDRMQNSNIYLQHLYKRVKFYQKQIELQTDNKPLIFQKNKLKNHYKKIEEYNDIIKETYKKIDEEIKQIFEINKQTKN